MNTNPVTFENSCYRAGTYTKATYRRASGQSLHAYTSTPYSGTGSSDNTKARRVFERIMPVPETAHQIFQSL